MIEKEKLKEKNLLIWNIWQKQTIWKKAEELKTTVSLQNRIFKTWC